MEKIGKILPGPKEETQQKITCAVIPAGLFQEVYDVIRHYVPHKHADTLLKQLAKTQFDEFPYKPGTEQK